MPISGITILEASICVNPVILKARIKSEKNWNRSNKKKTENGFSRIAQPIACKTTVDRRSPKLDGKLLTSSSK
jgi:hypothetical protein